MGQDTKELCQVKDGIAKEHIAIDVAGVVGENAEPAREPSPVACSLKRLKSAAFKAIQNRERVPHPLFWSLFLGEVSGIKQKKSEHRMLRRLIFGDTIE